MDNNMESKMDEDKNNMDVDNKVVLEENICKICHTGDTEEECLVYPCKCTGSIKYTHKSCLFMFIKSSGKEFCTICKYKYEFKEIYKPGTPSRLPIRLIIREAFSLFYKFGKEAVKYVILMLIVLNVSLINGFVLFNTLGWSFHEMVQIPFSLFTIGFILSLTSFTLYYLYERVSRVLELRIARRNIRIDSLSVMSSMASEALSHGDSPRTVLSNIAQERDLSFISTNDTPQIENPVPEVSSEEAEIVSPEVNFDVKIDITFIPKCCNFIFIVALFTRIIKFMKFELPDSTFTTFLKNIELYETTKIIGIFYCLFIISIISCRRWIKVYEFLKMINLLFVCFGIIVFTDGICIHFLFSEITGNGQLCLFNSSFGSFIFHIILGYGYNSFFKNYILLYSKKFRPGVIWNLAEPTHGTFEFCYKLSQRPLHVLSARMIRNSVLHLTAFSIILKIIKPEINRKFFFSDLYSVVMFIKLRGLISSSLDNFLKLVADINTYFIKFVSRWLNMQNYLFNEPVENIKNINQMKWCPNKHKFLDINVVKRKYKKKVTTLDVEKYYCKKNNNDFGVFYVPENCRFYLICLSLIITLITASAFRLILCITRHITDYLVRRYTFLVQYDMYLYLLIIALVTFSSSVSIRNPIKGLTKKLILILYINVIWPVWVSFVIVLLFGNDLMTVIPSTTFMILFSSSCVLSFFIYKLVFTIPLENYSYGLIIRRLYNITASFTIGISTFRYLRPYFIIGVGHVADIPFKYLIPVILIVLICNGQLYGGWNKFLDSVRRRNYLVDREILNCET